MNEKNIMILKKMKYYFGEIVLIKILNIKDYVYFYFKIKIIFILNKKKKYIK